jgi:sulfur carrier protein
MKAILNGETTEMPEGTTVQAMLSLRGVEGRRVAVEVNGVIVPKSLYAETLLKAGDTIEIIGFIGGG